MCGIFGQIALSENRILRRDLVSRGIDLLRHRGPDHQGVWEKEQVCFGHARLAIIDLKSGNQPFQTANGRGCITYNGEVYNFIEIRETLAKEGIVFITRSDTEVVLQAYLQWGPDCLKRFRGMFAFVAVDFEKKTILVARDRFGEKPLFYTFHPQGFFFSSELEPLYQTIGPFHLDLEALDEYLNWQYIHAPRTIYREVKALAPAHYLHLPLEGRFSEAVPRHYWSMSFSQDKSLSMEEWLESCSEKLREAVRIRLQCEIPFGVFLSGGIDSSLVLACMADLLDSPVKAFTLGFQEEAFNEIPFARPVAAAKKAQLFAETLTPDAFQLLPTLVRHFGQPFADSSALPTFALSRLASRQVKMVLGGDGADEHFAGYPRYPFILGKKTSWKSRTRQLLTHLTESFGWTNLFDLCRHLFFRKDPAGLLDQLYEKHYQTARHFSDDERRRLFRPQFRGISSGSHAYRRSLLETFDEPLITRIQHLDIMTYLPFDILTKVDTCSMANSLELRSPFLDHHLVESVARMPVTCKLRRVRTASGETWESKVLLKALARKAYGQALVDRPKMGFGVPLAQWFSGPLKAEITERLLLSETLPMLFEKDVVATLLQAHVPGHDCSTKLWNLLFLEEWLSTHREALIGL